LNLSAKLTNGPPSQSVVEDHQQIGPWKTTRRGHHSPQKSAVQKTATHAAREGDLKEAYDRAQAIVIRGLPESNSERPKDRVLHDVHQFQSVASCLVDSETNIMVLKAFRMGLKEDGRQRPLKIILDSVTHAQQLLDNKAKLRACHPAVFFQPDYHPLERKKMRDLRADLEKRRAAGEKHLVIKNLKIIKQKSFLWTAPLHMTLSVPCAPVQM